MKQHYQSPTLCVVTIKQTNIICTSPTYTVTETTNNVGVDFLGSDENYDGDVR
jgi:hypothetical protein